MTCGRVALEKEDGGESGDDGDDVMMKVIDPSNNYNSLVLLAKMHISSKKRVIKTNSLPVFLITSRPFCYHEQIR